LLASICFFETFAPFTVNPSSLAAIVSVPSISQAGAEAVVAAAKAKAAELESPIYKPAKTAMQSGFGNTKGWVLDFEPETPRRVEPLMGWTSSSDMRQQLRLRFDSKEEAVAYCERHKLAYEVFDAAPLKRRAMSYADNFSFKRRDPWTH